MKINNHISPTQDSKKEDEYEEYEDYKNWKLQAGQDRHAPPFY